MSLVASAKDTISFPLSTMVLSLLGRSLLMSEATLRPGVNEHARSIISYGL